MNEESFVPSQGVILLVENTLNLLMTARAEMTLPAGLERFSGVCVLYLKRAPGISHYTVRRRHDLPDSLHSTDSYMLCPELVSGMHLKIGYDLEPKWSVAEEYKVIRI